MCRTKILYSEDQLIISQCKDCKNVGIQMKNLLLNFKLHEFLNYSKKVSRIKFQQHAFQFEDETTKLILKTEDNKVNYCLDFEEFEILKTGMQIATLMIETDKILSNT